MADPQCIVIEDVAIAPLDGQTANRASGTGRANEDPHIVATFDELPGNVRAQESAGTHHLHLVRPRGQTRPGVMCRVGVRQLRTANGRSDHLVSCATVPSRRAGIADANVLGREHNAMPTATTVLMTNAARTVRRSELPPNTVAARGLPLCQAHLRHPPADN